MACTSFSVDLLVVTPNQLRKINLTLIKKCNPGDTVDWTMVFDLEERAKTTDPFQPLVTLKVTIHQDFHDKAEATAKHGLDGDQARASFAASDTAKLFKQKKVSKKRTDADAQNVIAARNPGSPIN